MLMIIDEKGKMEKGKQGSAVMCSGTWKKKIDNYSGEV
jgi:hypothetical protein